MARSKLRQQLEQRKISQVEVARQLGVYASQLSAWLAGTEQIPNRHLYELFDILQLTHDEAVELALFNECVTHLLELVQLFNIEGKKTKSRPLGAAAGLADHFDRPDETLGRLCDYAERLGAKDMKIFPADPYAKVMRPHYEAAHRCCADIDRLLISPEAAQLFTEKNIHWHLRYPHHYYLAFFLTEVTGADGAGAEILKQHLFDALESCLNFRTSENPTDLRIAQHALHLLARYRGDPTAKRLKSGDAETRRMAYFGRVYRDFDNGPFEELVRQIEVDERFAEATLRFDAMHYGDHRGANDRRDPARVPVATMARLIDGLSDARVSIRHLSAGRLLNIFRQYGGALVGSEEVAALVRERSQFVEALQPMTSALETVQSVLVEMTQRAKEAVRAERKT